MDRVIYPSPAIERETMRGTDQVSLVTSAFNERKIFLFGGVDEIMLNGFTMQMMYLQKEDKPISIIINSPGGIVPYGLGIYDLIQGCSCEINMYCIGLAASMGAVIFTGGQKGHRFLLPHAEMLIHEPLIDGGMGGSASTIKATAESILKTRDTLSSILARHTGKSVEEINKATEHDNRMSAEEAVAFGLADAIVDSIS